MEDANEVMYTVCMFTKLSVIVGLFHIRCLNKVTNEVFNMLLDLLRELVPSGDKKTDESYYAMKK